MKKYPSNSPCPCNSGKPYKACCKKKIEFFINEKGEAIQQIPLPEPALEIVEKLRIEFIEMFGREPGPDEPVFFHTLLISEDDYMEDMQEMFSEAGIPEEKFYAFKKTGFPITDDNIDQIPDIDIRTWNNAIKEYRQIKSGKKKIKRPEILNKIDALYQELELNQYLLGLIIYKQNDRNPRRRLDEHISSREYLLFCLTKNLKTLRAAINLMQSNFGEDALNLIRSIFENYLHIAMSIRNQEFMNDIQIKIGLLTGKYKQRKKGSDKVVETATGKELKLKYTRNHQLASSHPLYGELDLNIYDYLYEFLSSFTHPDMGAISYYTDQGGFNYLKRNFSHETTLYLAFINLLILNELKQFEHIDTTSVGDIERYTKRTAPLLLDIFKQLEKDFPSYPQFFRERVLRIA